MYSVKEKNEISQKRTIKSSGILLFWKISITSFIKENSYE